ncbi:hypothetical protein CMK11_18155 [Candidatus Poribacteria bacterium]|nr:hypothetical protein [Candidatus Poribacteria bacterium]
MRLRFAVGIALLFASVIAHAQVTNLALNPSFEEDEVILDDPDWLQWATWGDGDGLNTAIAVDDQEYIDGARSIRVEPQGAENWHFILLYLPVPSVSGTNYTTTFWAKAGAERPLGVQYKATDNTVSWGYEDFVLSEEWTEYVLTSAAESAELKTEFFCAASDVPFWIDFVNIYEGDYVEGVLPSMLLVTAIDPAGSASVTWGDVKAAR